mmetsp:Transcript_57266/g.118529  ORF Transcript_57266/g.118529 Transcript_57266/m.118529 type:complete len:219 (-) Transcript_57266:7-663(-)
MNLISCPRGHEVAVQVVLFRELIVFVYFHSSDMRQVVLVCHQSNVRKRRLVKRALDQEQPVLQMLEALIVGDVVAEDDSTGAIDVVAQHLATNGLAANVPYLQAYVNVAWQNHSLDKEIQAYRLLVLLGKVILAESRGHRSLSNCTVAEKNYLELQVFRFIFIIVFTQLRSQLGHDAPLKLTGVLAQTLRQLGTGCALAGPSNQSSCTLRHKELTENA